MGELEDLKREEARLLAQQSAREDINMKDLEKTKIKKRIWRLKHHKIVKVINIGKRSVQGVGMIAKKGFDSARPYLEQGARNFYGNVNQPRVKKKKVVRVKKSKGKRKIKKVRRNNEVFNFRSPFG